MILRFCSDQKHLQRHNRLAASVFNDIQTKLTTKHVHNLVSSLFPYAEDRGLQRSIDRRLLSENTPTTEESTPPDRPRSSLSLIRIFDLHIDESIDQSPLNWQMLRAVMWRISFLHTECMNCGIGYHRCACQVFNSCIWQSAEVPVRTKSLEFL